MKKIKPFLWCILTVLLAVGLPLSPYAQLQTQSMDEYQAKSIWLYKIFLFTTWPQPINKDKPFVLSILGKLPPDSRFALNKKLNKRDIEIRMIKDLEEINGSDILFIASSESHRVRTIMAYVGNKPILTVSDTEGYSQKGVAINFYVTNQNIRFEINPDSIKRAQLQLHAHLFQIGRVIRTSPFDEDQ